MNYLDKFSFFQHKDNRTIFIIVYILSFLSYSYLFTGSVYNNHDLPNSFYTSYPSFSTTQEGRFIGDILYQLQGGAGIPAFNMAIAVLIQILNGFLLVSLLGITGFLARLSLITIFTIHPAITDYYSWGGVGISFILGETFAIAAIIFCLRKGIYSALISITFVVFSVATYQPKVVSVATIFLVALIAKILNASYQKKGDENFSGVDLFRSICNDVAKFVLIIGSSILVYLLIFHLTVEQSVIENGASFRLHLNSTIGEFLVQIKKILSYTGKYFLTCQNFLHSNEFYFPAICVASFIFAGIIRSYKSVKYYKAVSVVVFLLCISMLPLAINLVFLITTKAYGTDGRFFGMYALVLAYFIAYLIDKTKLSRGYVILFLLLTTYYVFDNAQYSYRGYMQNRFEYSYVTRIVARLEDVIDPAKTYKLITIGDLPWSENKSKLSRKGNIMQRQVIANYDQPGFIHYRRVEYLNFLLGRQAFTQPSNEDKEKANKYAADKDKWPAKNTVIILDDILILLL